MRSHKKRSFSQPGTKANIASVVLSSSSTWEQIEQQTPCLKKLYEFLRRPLPDGTRPSFHERDRRSFFKN